VLLLHSIIGDLCAPASTPLRCLGSGSRTTHNFPSNPHNLRGLGTLKMGARVPWRRAATGEASTNEVLADRRFFGRGTSVHSSMGQRPAESRGYPAARYDCPLSRSWQIGRWSGVCCRARPLARRGAWALATSTCQLLRATATASRAEPYKCRRELPLEPRTKTVRLGRPRRPRESSFPLRSIAACRRCSLRPERYSVCLRATG
jgi:hypothetical protein